MPIAVHLRRGRVIVRIVYPLTAADAITIGSEDYTTRAEMEEMYCFSEDSLQHLINRIACYVGGDCEYGEHIISDFVCGIGLETEVM